MYEKGAVPDAALSTRTSVHCSDFFAGDEVLKHCAIAVNAGNKEIIREHLKMDDFPEIQYGIAIPYFDFEYEWAKQSAADLKDRIVCCLMLNACDPRKDAGEELPTDAAMYVILRAPGEDVVGEQYSSITNLQLS